MPYTHLHVHTHYSLLDGLSSPKVLLQATKDAGMDSLAITDHGSMMGSVNFYKEAKKAGIKPIIGMEAYIAGADDMADREIRSNRHLVLLAKNKTGYTNLCRLSTLSYLEGFYYRPRLDTKTIAKHSEGLICLTACIAGSIPQAIIKEDEAELRRIISHYRSIFGKDLYFEIMDHGIEEEDKVNHVLADITYEYSIPVVATNDIHYMSNADAEAQATLMAVNTGGRRWQIKNGLLVSYRDEKTFELSGDKSYHLRTEKEMATNFSWWHEGTDTLLSRSQEIADSVEEYDISFGKMVIPSFALPIPGMSSKDMLTALCERRMTEEGMDQEHWDRYHRELAVIERRGFIDLYLIVSDLMRHARSQGIATGPARGSAAASLISYLLDITAVDPLRYGLLFERFISDTDESNVVPDFDLDFSQDRRQEIIDYLKMRYPYSAQLLALGTLGAKKALRDVARVMSIPLADADRAAKLVPPVPEIKLADALVDSKEFHDYMHQDDIHKFWLGLAMKVEGCPRNESVHAAGMVIADFPLEDTVPLLRRSGKGAVTTQYDKDELEWIGLPKLDILGLANVQIINYAMKLLGNKFDLRRIPMDDELTMELLRNGPHVGLFQIEGADFSSFVRSLQPPDFLAVAHAIAMYRPGPLESGATASLMSRRHGREPVTYPHPNLEAILQETYGTIIYQEQVLLIAKIIAGFSLPEGDQLRKALGKKNHDKIAEMRPKFVDGAVALGYDREFADKLYDDLAIYATYAFNKSHAVGYAHIVYWEAYLAAHFPLEFYCATFDVADSRERISQLLSVANQRGIKVLPPDVNKSGKGFTVENGAIRFSIKNIFGIGEKGCEVLISERNTNGPFTSIEDFRSRVAKRAVNAKALESLIASGAMDSLLTQQRHDELGVSWKDACTKEFDALGAYMVYDLFAVHKVGFAKHFGGEPLPSVSMETAAGTHNWMLVNLQAVRPHTYKKRSQKRNGDVEYLEREMAFINMVDSYGNVSGVMFAEAYKAHPYLNIGSIYYVYGKVEMRKREGSSEGSPQIIIEKMMEAE